MSRSLIGTALNAGMAEPCPRLVQIGFFPHFCRFFPFLYDFYSIIFAVDKKSQN